MDEDISLGGGRRASREQLALIDQIVGAKRLPVETISARVEVTSADVVEVVSVDVPEYEIDGMLGEGGMGSVFDVHQTSLDRNVALKLFKGAEANNRDEREGLKAFAKEAYVTAQLDHPAVVPIYALAKDVEGRLFFTMKKVEGVSWRYLLHPNKVKDETLKPMVEARAAAMTWRDHIDILLRVMDAVSFAHNKKLLHRDIKPDNVMVGAFGEVYLMDWGLALYFDERNEFRGSKVLQLAGTPRYMAPEMARGELGDLDASADVYLLGSTLYEVITGQVPRKGKKMRPMLMDVMKGVVEDPANAPAPIHVTPEMRRIVMKAQAPERADRYPSVAAFKADLMDYLGHVDSITITTETQTLLEDYEASLLDTSSGTTVVRTISREEAAGWYGKLSECVGRFERAIEQWKSNDIARLGLLNALATHTRLAIAQHDLTLAQAQLTRLDSVAGDDPVLAAKAASRKRKLEERITAVRGELAARARRGRRLRAMAWLLGAVAAAGLAFGVYMLERRRALAAENQLHMLEAAVTARAGMIEQFIIDVERLTGQYQLEAAALMGSALVDLPRRPLTPAGRDGYYYDEDYYAPALRPADVVEHAGYHGLVSFSAATVVRAPWIQTSEQQAAADADARRLGRLARRFGQVHAVQGQDLKWSLAGSPTGLLVGFPGSGRYRDKPEYDPTKRPWYTVAINAQNDRPIWGNPYVDASTGLILVSCISRIHVEGANVGVVGVEVTLETMRDILLDFARKSSGKMRSILVRPFPRQGAPGTTEHRVVIDTRGATRNDDWQAQLTMPLVSELDDALAEYVTQAIASPESPPQRVGSTQFAHARLARHDWLLVVTSEAAGDSD